MISQSNALPFLIKHFDLQLIALKVITIQIENAKYCNDVTCYDLRNYSSCTDNERFNSLYLDQDVRLNTSLHFNEKFIGSLSHDDKREHNGRAKVTVMSVHGENTAGFS
jgi:hypothetical protein